MSKITQDSSVDRAKDLAEQGKLVARYLEQVTQAINNGLTFAENFDGKMLTLTFIAANADTTLAHGLGRVASGYVVLRRSANMVVYDGSAAWTAANVYLRSSAAGSITLFVY